MATTYNQRFGAIPGFSHLKPENQIKSFRREFGENTVIYTYSPNLWAEKLQ